MTAVLVKLVPEAPRLGSNSQIRVFEKAKGDYWRRSWVRQSSGALPCRIPKSGTPATDSA